MQTFWSIDLNIQSNCHNLLYYSPDETCDTLLEKACQEDHVTLLQLLPIKNRSRSGNWIKIFVKIFFLPNSVNSTRRDIKTIADAIECVHSMTCGD